MIPDQTKTNANIKKNAYQHQTKKLKGPIPDKKHSTKRNACGKTNTTGPNGTKLGRKHLYKVLYKVSSFRPIPPTNMAAKGNSCF
jgi:hypothetical protein